MIKKSATVCAASIFELADIFNENIKMKKILSTILLSAITVNSYSQKNEKNFHGKYWNEIKCKCPDSYGMNEVSGLIHVKNQFYKNEKGHLYIKTLSAGHPSEDGKDEKGTEYFSSSISQEIDVKTFKGFDDSGWTYAQDKNNIYYVKSDIIGDHIWLMKNADVKNFKLLNTISDLFAMDKKHIYHNDEILVGFDPNKTKFKRNKKGIIIELVQGKLKYKI